MTEIERLLVLNQIEIITALRQTNDTVGLRYALINSQRALARDEREARMRGKLMAVLADVQRADDDRRDN